MMKTIFFENAVVIQLKEAPQVEEAWVFHLEEARIFHLKGV